MQAATHAKTRFTFRIGRYFFSFYIFWCKLQGDFCKMGHCLRRPSTSQPLSFLNLTYCAFLNLRLVALGAPVGTSEYKRQHLQRTLAQHTELLRAIPAFDDLQAPWLLLLFCASPRCNYHLRMLPPEETATFAQDHDTAVAACFTQLLDTGPIPATSLAIAHLPPPFSPHPPIGPHGPIPYQF